MLFARQALEGIIRAALVTPDLRHAGAFHATFLVVGLAAGACVLDTPACACVGLCVGCSCMCMCELYG